jgi:hypothetical protein
MGLLIGLTGDFTAGLEFLVLSCIVCSFLMLPLVRKY